MNTEYLAKSLWLFVLLVMWARPLQSVKAKRTLAFFAFFIYGIFLWLSWHIVFSLAQPLTDLQPGKEFNIGGQKNVLSYDDKRAVLIEDSNYHATKLSFISLHDGKIIAENNLPGNHESYPFNTVQYCDSNTQVFLVGNSPEILVAIRENKMLLFQPMDESNDSFYYHHSLLKKDDGQFVLVTKTMKREYNPVNADSFHFTFYDKNFVKQGEQSVYLRSRDISNDLYERSKQFFTYKNFFFEGEKLFATSEEDQVIVELRKKSGTDTLELVNAFADTITPKKDSIENLLYTRKDGFVYFTGAKARFFPFKSWWKPDERGNINYSFGNLKFHDGELFPDYGAQNIHGDTVLGNEMLMGKYIVDYSGNEYNNGHLPGDPGEGWAIDVQDSLQQKKMNFVLSDFSFGQLQLFLTGDTLVVFADNFQEMARFNLSNGIRLDQIPVKQRFFSRIYPYQRKHEILYDILILFSFFFLPVILILGMTSKIIFRKNILPWFNLQRASTLYIILSLITLIQIVSCVW